MRNCQNSARKTWTYSNSSQSKLLINGANSHCLLINAAWCCFAPGVCKTIVYVYLSPSIVNIHFYVEFNPLQLLLAPPTTFKYTAFYEPFHKLLYIGLERYYADAADSLKFLRPRNMLRTVLYFQP